MTAENVKIKESPEEERAARIITSLGRKTFPTLWDGTTGETTEMTTILENFGKNLLPRLISRLEGYRDEKGKRFFAGREQTLDAVLEDLLLVYLYGAGEESNAAFSRNRPRAWESGEYWPLVCAFGLYYPNGANPFLQLADYAAADGSKGKLFEAFFQNGEEKPDYALGQPIEPRRLGIHVRGLPYGILSPRQALGLLVKRKEQEANVARERHPF
ncbi:hypothetical protein KBI33_00620 [Candidatus Shapirobacteria bacterium]|nr:hypothetical protein [Candidatus Shapirobacteria bacterium]